MPPENDIRDQEHGFVQEADPMEDVLKASRIARAVGLGIPGANFVATGVNPEDYKRYNPNSIFLDPEAIKATNIQRAQSQSGIEQVAKAVGHIVPDAVLGVGIGLASVPEMFQQDGVDNPALQMLEASKKFIDDNVIGKIYKEDPNAILAWDVGTMADSIGQGISSMGSMIGTGLFTGATIKGLSTVGKLGKGMQAIQKVASAQGMSNTFSAFTMASQQAVETRRDFVNHLKDKLGYDDAQVQTLIEHDEDVQSALSLAMNTSFGWSFAANVLDGGLELAPFMRNSQVGKFTRSAVEKPFVGNTYSRALRQGLKEGATEIPQEIAEGYGQASGLHDAYEELGTKHKAVLPQTVKEAIAHQEGADFLSYALSTKGWQSGLLGGLVGFGVGGTSSIVGDVIEKLRTGESTDSRLKKQATAWDVDAAAAKEVGNVAKDLASVLTNKAGYETALKAGDVDKAEKIKDKIFRDAYIRTFKNGTAETLDSTFQEAIQYHQNKAEQVKKDPAAYAEAIAKVKEVQEYHDDFLYHEQQYNAALDGGMDHQQAVDFTDSKFIQKNAKRDLDILKPKVEELTNTIDTDVANDTKQTLVAAIRNNAAGLGNKFKEYSSSIINPLTNAGTTITPEDYADILLSGNTAGLTKDQVDTVQSITSTEEERKLTHPLYQELEATKVKVDKNQKEFDSATSNLGKFTKDKVEENNVANNQSQAIKDAVDELGANQAIDEASKTEAGKALLEKQRLDIERATAGVPIEPELATKSKPQTSTKPEPKVESEFERVTRLAKEEAEAIKADEAARKAIKFKPDEAEEAVAKIERDKLVEELKAKYAAEREGSVSTNESIAPEATDSLGLHIGNISVGEHIDNKLFVTANDANPNSKPFLLTKNKETGLLKLQLNPTVNEEGRAKLNALRNLKDTAGNQLLLGDGDILIEFLNNHEFPLNEVKVIKDKKPERGSRLRVKGQLLLKPDPTKQIESTKAAVQEAIAKEDEVEIPGETVKDSTDIYTDSIEIATDKAITKIGDYVVRLQKRVSSLTGNTGVNSLINILDKLNKAIEDKNPIDLLISAYRLKKAAAHQRTKPTNSLGESNALKAIVDSCSRIIETFEEFKFEVIDLTGGIFIDGMTVDSTWVKSDDPTQTKDIISNTTKPQINYADSLISIPKVEITYGYSSTDENIESEELIKPKADYPYERYSKEALARMQAVANLPDKTSYRLSYDHEYVGHELTGYSNSSIITAIPDKGKLYTSKEGMGGAYVKIDPPIKVEAETSVGVWTVVGYLNDTADGSQQLIKKLSDSEGTITLTGVAVGGDPRFDYLTKLSKIGEKFTEAKYANDTLGKNSLIVSMYEGKFTDLRADFQVKKTKEEMFGEGVTLITQGSIKPKKTTEGRLLANSHTLYYIHNLGGGTIVAQQLEKSGLLAVEAMKKSDSLFRQLLNLAIADRNTLTKDNPSVLIWDMFKRSLLIGDHNRITNGFGEDPNTGKGIRFHYTNSKSETQYSAYLKFGSTANNNEIANNIISFLLGEKRYDEEGNPLTTINEKGEVVPLIMSHGSDLTINLSFDSNATQEGWRRAKTQLPEGVSIVDIFDGIAFSSTRETKLLPNGTRVINDNPKNVIFETSTIEANDLKPQETKAIEAKPKVSSGRFEAAQEDHFTFSPAPLNLNPEVNETIETEENPLTKEEVDFVVGEEDLDTTIALSDRIGFNAYEIVGDRLVNNSLPRSKQQMWLNNLAIEFTKLWSNSFVDYKALESKIGELYLTSKDLAEDLTAADLEERKQSEVFFNLLQTRFYSKDNVGKLSTEQALKDIIADRYHFEFYKDGEVIKLKPKDSVVTETSDSNDQVEDEVQEEDDALANEVKDIDAGSFTDWESSFTSNPVDKLTAALKRAFNGIPEIEMTDKGFLPKLINSFESPIFYRAFRYMDYYTVYTKALAELEGSHSAIDMLATIEKQATTNPIMYGISKQLEGLGKVSANKKAARVNLMYAIFSQKAYRFISLRLLEEYDVSEKKNIPISRIQTLNEDPYASEILSEWESSITNSATLGEGNFTLDTTTDEIKYNNQTKILGDMTFFEVAKGYRNAVVAFAAYANSKDADTTKVMSDLIIAYWKGELNQESLAKELKFLDDIFKYSKAMLSSVGYPGNVDIFPVLILEFFNSKKNFQYKDSNNTNVLKFQSLQSALLDILEKPLLDFSKGLPMSKDAPISSENRNYAIQLAGILSSHDLKPVTQSFSTSEGQVYSIANNFNIMKRLNTLAKDKTKVINVLKNNYKRSSILFSQWFNTFSENYMLGGASAEVFLAAKNDNSGKEEAPGALSERVHQLYHFGLMFPAKDIKGLSTMKGRAVVPTPAEKTTMTTFGTTMVCNKAIMKQEYMNKLFDELYRIKEAYQNFLNIHTIEDPKAKAEALSKLEEGYHYKKLDNKGNPIGFGSAMFPWVFRNLMVDNGDGTQGYKTLIFNSPSLDKIEVKTFLEALSYTGNSAGNSIGLDPFRPIGIADVLKRRIGEPSYIADDSNKYVSALLRMMEQEVDATLADLYKDTKQTWSNVGLLVDGKLPYLDKKAVELLGKINYGEKENFKPNEGGVDRVIAMYAHNYALHYMDYLSLTSDPAVGVMPKMGNIEGNKTIKANSYKYEETYGKAIPNLIKRRAKETAPASRTNFYKPTYNLVVFEDRVVDMAKGWNLATHEQYIGFLVGTDEMPILTPQQIEFYNNVQNLASYQAKEHGKVFEEVFAEYVTNAAKVYADYAKMNSTDAQEFITLEHHLHTLLAEGKGDYEDYGIPINPKDTATMFNLTNAGITNIIPMQFKGGKYSPKLTAEWCEENKKTKGQWYKLTTGIDANSNQTSYGQQKPRVAGTTSVELPSGTVDTDIYVKSSTVTILPYLLGDNSEQGKLLAWMYDNNVDSTAFESAVKEGTNGKAVKGFKENGSFDPTVEAKPILINRDDFGIQQVSQEQKNKLTAAKQPNTNIWSDLMTRGMRGMLVDTVINGTPFQATVEKLNEVTHTIQRALIGFRKQEFIDKVDFNKELDTLGEDGVQALFEFLDSELATRFKSSFAREGLGMDGEKDHKKLIMALTAHPLYAKLETATLSWVSKYTTKIKRSGFSTVLATETGYTTNRVDQDEAIKTGVTWLGNNTGNRSLAKDELIVTFPFGETLKDRQDNFAKFKAGTLTIDPELLEMVGFRIPGAYLNAITSLKVVGFLDPNKGTEAVPSMQLTVAMGSDFDVDKLYIYKHNHEAKEGFITKVNKDVETNLFNTLNALDYNAGLESIVNEYNLLKLNGINSNTNQTLISLQNELAELKSSGLVLGKELLQLLDTITAQASVGIKQQQLTYRRKELGVELENIEVETLKKKMQIEQVKKTALEEKEATLGKYIKAIENLQLDIELAVLRNDTVKALCAVPTGEGEFKDLAVKLGTTESTGRKPSMTFPTSDMNEAIKGQNSKMGIAMAASYNQAIPKFQATNIFISQGSGAKLDGKVDSYPELNELLDSIKDNFPIDISKTFLTKDEFITALRTNNADVLESVEDEYDLFWSTVAKDLPYRLTLDTDLQSSWRLDKTASYSSGGIANNISWVVQHMMSLIVDDPKNGFMAMLNLNDVTLNVALFLAHSGVEPKVIAHFMKQPIIIELVKQVKNGSDITQEYSQSDIAKAATALRKDTDITSKANMRRFVKQRVVLDNLSFESLEGGLGKIDSAVQADVLDHFVEYHKLATDVRKVIKHTDFFNVSLGINVEENISIVDKELKVSSLGNIDNILSDRYSWNALREACQISSKLFASRVGDLTLSDYTSQTFTKFKENAIAMGAKVLETVKGKARLNRLIKQFVISTTTFEDGYIDSLVSMDSKTNLIARRKVIGKIVGENLFLDSLKFSVATKNKVKLAKVEKHGSAKAQELDAIYTAFDELTNHPNSDVREFVRDIVNYSIFTGSDSLTKGMRSYYDLLRPGYLIDRNKRQASTTGANYLDKYRYYIYNMGAAPIIDRQTIKFFEQVALQNRDLVQSAFSIDEAIKEGKFGEAKLKGDRLIFNINAKALNNADSDSNLHRLATVESGRISPRLYLKHEGEIYKADNNSLNVGTDNKGKHNAFVLTYTKISKTPPKSYLLFENTYEVGNTKPLAKKEKVIEPLTRDKVVTIIENVIKIGGNANQIMPTIIRALKEGVVPGSHPALIAILENTATTKKLREVKFVMGESSAEDIHNYAASFNFKTNTIKVKPGLLKNDLNYIVSTILEETVHSLTNLETAALKETFEQAQKDILVGEGDSSTFFELIQEGINRSGYKTVGNKVPVDQALTTLKNKLMVIPPEERLEAIKKLLTLGLNKDVNNTNVELVSLALRQNSTLYSLVNGYEFVHKILTDSTTQEDLKKYKGVDYLNKLIKDLYNTLAEAIVRVTGLDFRNKEEENLYTQSLVASLKAISSHIESKVEVKVETKVEPNENKTVSDSNQESTFSPINYYDSLPDKYKFAFVTLKDAGRIITDC